MISEPGRSDRIGGASVAVTPACPDGVLNVYKEPGNTSHDVVAKLRRLLGGVKIGHAGTLDPAATGVLPVLVGKATRIAEYLIGWDKEYRARLRLGEATDTQDATGIVVQSRPTAHVTEERVREVIARFQGRVTQVPPMYSAVKVAGVPLYKAARAGRTVERAPREVTVHHIEVLDIRGRDVALAIECSKGTYVRTLCADIGEALGVGGHLLALERRRVGPLTVDRASRLEEIGSKVLLGRLGEMLLPLDEALAAMPTLVVDAPTATRVLHGVPLPVEARGEMGAWGESSLKAGQVVRLKDGSGLLLGLGQWPVDDPIPAAAEGRSGRRVRILKVFADVQEKG
jgi:tRNA pseudouridine55 synthase